MSRRLIRVLDLPRRAVLRRRLHRLPHMHRWPILELLRCAHTSDRPNLWCLDVLFRSEEQLITSAIVWPMAIRPLYGKGAADLVQHLRTTRDPSKTYPSCAEYKIR